MFIAVRYEAARRLGRPADGGTLEADALAGLKRLGYVDWAAGVSPQQQAAGLER